MAFCCYRLVGNFVWYATLTVSPIMLGEPYGTLILTLSAISIEGGDDIHGNVARCE